MFRCTVCKENIGPRVGAVRVVTGTRPVAYHNEFYREDEWGNREKHEVDSLGTEITGEALSCPQCAGVQPRVIPSITIIGAQSFHEKPADPFKVKLVASAVHTARERIAHKSKRADRDIAVAVPLIKQFLDDNNGFTF